MDNDLNSIDFEEWEGDFLLIEDEDWPGLVKLRKQRAEKRPSDFISQWRYDEALIFNQEFKQALEFLTPIYKKDPNHPDVIHFLSKSLCLFAVRYLTGIYNFKATGMNFY